MSLKDEATRACAGWRPDPEAPSPTLREPPPLVLFLCRSNTAVSIMAEAICEHYAQGEVRACSAGDLPAVQVSPFALECLRTHGIPARGLRSKPWGEFFGLCKPPIRFLITLRESYAANANWNHDTHLALKAHWTMLDPANAAGSDADVRLAFEAAFRMLESRIRKFLALPLHRMPDEVLRRELALIGDEL
jgi:arsenate reductase (thioredoxin)